MMGLALVRATHTASMRGEQVQIWLEVILKTCEWVIVKSWLHQKKKHSLTDGSKRGKFSAQQSSGWTPTEIQLKPKQCVGLEPLSFYSFLQVGPSDEGSLSDSRLDLVG